MLDNPYNLNIEHYSDGDLLVRDTGLDGVDGWNNVCIHTQETHQWKHSDNHLPRSRRRTYVSSRWYRVTAISRRLCVKVEFRVKVTNSSEEAFNKAFDKLANIMQRLDAVSDDSDLPKTITRHLKPFTPSNPISS